MSFAIRAATGASAATLACAAELPTWDLSDLYPGQDSPDLARDLDEAEAAARAFAGRYAGRLAALDGAGLAAAIAEYERIDAVLGRAASYAGLLFAGDSEDAAIGRFYQGVNERVTQLSTPLIFFTLELNQLDDDALAGLQRDPALARWEPFLRDLRVFRPHQLSEEVERVLHEKIGHRAPRLGAGCSTRPWRSSGLSWTVPSSPSATR